MGDSYGGGKKAVETEELQEEQVWAVGRARGGGGSKTKGSTGFLSAWRAKATARPAGRKASAPVDIPGRSKINGGGEEEEEEEEMGPPHEYLARRLARTQIASHSMCEGVGRTLKGRDLSKVRNAILTNTGFIE